MITKSNIEVLKGLIDCITSMVEWTDCLKSSDRADTFKILVESRRELNRIYHSLKSNPTIAAYGESQKGKSYIIASLLSSPAKADKCCEPLKIKDENGQELDFIKNFNRKTKNQESTGVVTRFTTEKVSDNAKYPIRITTLSIADLITMLADCYMQAINDGTILSKEDLKEISNDLVATYGERPVVQHYLTEDEVGDIRDFLAESHPSKTENFCASGWFDSLALVIRRVPEEKWPDVFKHLWSQNETFTDFMGLAVKSYHTIGFSADVYIDTKPVLNDRHDGSETLMSVNAIMDTKHGIKTFFNTNGRISVPVTVCLPSGQTVIIDKAMLSVMAAEVVYHVDADKLKNELSFDFSGIRESQGGRSSAENIEYLKGYGFDKPASRNFLICDNGKDYCFDLLDFPGARVTGTGYKGADIAAIIDDFILREKVSYLFRKYSAEKRLSILLLCNDEENVTKNLVTPQLSDWVENVIGKSPAERQNNLRNYEISPLFLICTKYNRDLVIDGKLDTSVFKRRFEEKMYDELIEPNLHSWFNDWIPGGRFDNTYLLRDYEFSSDVKAEGSCLFKGYPHSEHCELNKEERAELKKIFLEDESVRLFFNEPELAWNTASTIGNDGSYFLIKQLSKVTPNVEKARCIAFGNDIEKVLNKVQMIIAGKYHSENAGRKLEESIAKGRNFDWAIRCVTNNDNEDFFGRFIQFLQMTPNYVCSVFSDIVHSLRIANSTKLKQYELIIKGVEEAGEHFEPKNEKHNYEVLMRVFGVRPGDPLLEGIDMEKLFTQTFDESRSASYVMSKALVDRWMSVIQSPAQSLYFTQMGFNSTVLAHFLSNFESVANFTGLRTAIANAISEYVDYTPDIKEGSLALIADVAAGIYNTFVMDMGYSLLQDPQLDKVRPDAQKGAKVLEDIRQHNEMYQLNLSLDYGITERENSTDREAVAQIFQSLEALGSGEGGGQMLKLPSYTNLKRWIEMVKISYIANFEAVDYDVEANERLGSIIKQFDTERQKC